jgi:hypothetical protein
MPNNSLKDFPRLAILALLSQAPTRKPRHKSQRPGSGGIEP